MNNRDYLFGNQMVVILLDMYFWFVGKAQKHIYIWMNFDRHNVTIVDILGNFLLRLAFSGQVSIL